MAVLSSDGSSDLSVDDSLTGNAAPGGDYGFSYDLTPSPPSQVATTATQFDAGGSAVNFNWNKALSDALGAAVALDSVNHQWAGPPNGYYQGANGQVYPIGQGPVVSFNQAKLSNLLVFGGLIFIVLRAVRG